MAAGVLPGGCVFEFAREFIRLSGVAARTRHVLEGGIPLTRCPRRRRYAAPQLGRREPDLEVHRVMGRTPAASPPKDLPPVHGTDGLDRSDLLRREHRPGYSGGDLLMPLSLGRLVGEAYGSADVVTMRVPLRVDIDGEPVSMQRRPGRLAGCSLRDVTAVVDPDAACLIARPSQGLGERVESIDGDRVDWGPVAEQRYSHHLARGAHVIGPRLAQLRRRQRAVRW